MNMILFKMKDNLWKYSECSLWGIIIIYNSQRRALSDLRIMWPHQCSPLWLVESKSLDHELDFREWPIMINVLFLFFRWNPFARKSRGILGVIKGKSPTFWRSKRLNSGSTGNLSAQTKKNRVVSKHGRINVHRKTEDKENQHR